MRILQKEKGMLREKTDRKGDKFRLLLFLVLTAVCLASGMGAFFSSSPMKEKLFGSEGRQMLGETLLIFAGQIFFSIRRNGFCAGCPEEEKEPCGLRG